MGDLSDAVRAAGPVTGQPSTFPLLLAVLPQEAADDIRDLFDDPTANIAETRRQVMERFPDAPTASESTWFYWARQWRRHGKRY